MRGWNEKYGEWKWKIIEIVLCNGPYFNVWFESLSSKELFEVANQQKIKSEEDMVGEELIRISRIFSHRNFCCAHIWVILKKHKFLFWWSSNHSFFLKVFDKNGVTIHPDFPWQVWFFGLLSSCPPWNCPDVWIENNRFELNSLQGINLWTNYNFGHRLMSRLKTIFHLF